MEVVAFILPFVLLGALVLFVAFSGGPGQAREAYLTRGSRLFQISMVAIYVGFVLVVPGLVLANRDEAAGSIGALRGQELTASEERGRQLFRERCASCHTLAAAGARGATGPNLDRIGEVTTERILNAIDNGGTGQGLMPADILEGQDAQDVADYVARVAGAN
ncbi:MAG: cytochrome c [Thermoleophilaceae bacterium]